MVFFCLIGSGGGGAGGASGASLTLRAGGGGGGSASITCSMIPAIFLPDKLFVIVARGGAGDPAALDAQRIGGQRKADRRD